MLTCSRYSIPALSAHSCDKNTTCSTAHVHVLRQSIECPTIERKTPYIVRLYATCVCEPTIMCMKAERTGVGHVGWLRTLRATDMTLL